MDYEIEYSPKVPYSEGKIKSIVNECPTPHVDGVGIHYDTCYECYVQIVSETEGFFYFNNNWSKESMPLTMMKRLKKNQGLMSIKELTTKYGDSHE